MKLLQTSSKTSPVMGYVQILSKNDSHVGFHLLSIICIENYHPNSTKPFIASIIHSCLLLPSCFFKVASTRPTQKAWVGNETARKIIYKGDNGNLPHVFFNSCVVLLEMMDLSACCSLSKGVLELLVYLGQVFSNLMCSSSFLPNKIGKEDT